LGETLDAYCVLNERRNTMALVSLFCDPLAQSCGLPDVSLCQKWQKAKVKALVGTLGANCVLNERANTMALLSLLCDLLAQSCGRLTFHSVKSGKKRR
jgi:hypothetical protein